LSPGRRDQAVVVGIETVFDGSIPIELAPRVWWVGSMLSGDQFQCHVYLIEQGDQSVLIDPGSALNVDEVIGKIDSVIGVENVRWLVCSHADPDIYCALPALVARGLHPEAAIVTHWRDEALLRHTGTRLPFWLVEEHDWRLPLSDRALQFVFTPYAHFAGAFCTFDETSGTLFSSDLFGGFTDDSSLYATSMAYFEEMRAFHEHYMPSREIVVHALDQLRELPIRQIAPQHGRVIPENLIAPITDELAHLECGIYLLARNDPGLAFLLEANRAIHDVLDTLVGEPKFAAVAAHFADLASQTLGAESLEFWAQAGATLLHFDRSDGFEGRIGEPPEDVAAVLAGEEPEPSDRLLIPLTSPASGRVVAVAVLEFLDRPELDEPSRAALQQIADLVEVGMEREVLRRVGDFERSRLYEQAVHDPLTGLHNRLSLDDATARICATDDRGSAPKVAALMIDIDHFKRVNDTYGHPVGDRVLQHVARSIALTVRPGDIAVRFGGEEFLVVLAEVDGDSSSAIAERIRARIADPVPGQPTITASIGIALRLPHEGGDNLVKRADEALYEAKEAGRDQIAVSGGGPLVPGTVGPPR
jgi:diguanylate cyclase (GGDEF)-like protein